MADVWANSMACHPTATCHIAGCSHLAKSMWLWRAAAFVSSPIHLLLLCILVLGSTRVEDALVDTSYPAFSILRCLLHLVRYDAKHPLNRRYYSFCIISRYINWFLLFLPSKNAVHLMRFGDSFTAVAYSWEL